MFNIGDKVIYWKKSAHGVGDIALNSIGKIIKKSEDKFLIEFENGKKALIPASYIKLKD